MDANRRSLPFVIALVFAVATLPVSARPPRPAALVAGVARSPIGIAVLPALRSVVTADGKGTVDTFDRSLHLRASVHVCAEPRWLVGDDRHGRILVGCHDPHAAADDDRGELAAVDIRANTLVARLPGIATRTIAAIEASPRALAYARRTDGTVARFDPGSGRIFDVIALDGAKGDRLRFVAGDARTPMIALDHDADRVFAIEATGPPLAIALGRRRHPSDAVLDGRRLIVALSGAGTLDSIDLARPDDHRIVPAIDTPIAVARGRGRQFLAVGRPSWESADLAVVAVNEGAAARVVRIIRRADDWPYPFDTTQTTFDRVTGRLIVATARQVVVVDPGGTSFSVDVLRGTGITGLALDAATGDAYVAIRDDSGGAIARIPIRGERPGSPDPGPDRLLATRGMISTGVFMLEGEDENASPDPPGRRSPAQLLARSDGSLVVADLLSPTLGTFSAGTYREEPLASSAAPGVLAYGSDGALWFSETTSHDRGIVGRQGADGRIAEFSLPARADKIVAADDGLYWIARYPAQQLGRIAPDGTVSLRSVTLPEPDLGQRGLVDVAAAPGGGCYALYDDKLVLVRPDGSTKVFRDFPAGFGFGHASAVAALPDGGVAVALDRVIVRYERTGSRRVYWPLPRETIPDRAGSFRTCRISELAARSDDSVWGVCGERIISVSKSGLIRTVVPPVPQSAPRSLVEARDGSMWFAEPAHSALGRIASDGTLTEFPL